LGVDVKQEKTGLFKNQDNDTKLNNKVKKTENKSIQVTNENKDLPKKDEEKKTDTGMSTKKKVIIIGTVLILAAIGGYVGFNY
jgi:hypothetical protein